MSWVVEEMRTVNLGDKRLHKRLLSLFLISFRLL
ncbi:transposase DNA-binding-containing protein [Legionella sainthelensi]